MTAVRGVAAKFAGPATGWHPQAGDGHATVLNGRRQPGAGDSARVRARAYLAAGDIPLFRRLSAAGNQPGTETPATARAWAYLAAGDIPLFRRLSQRADQAGPDGPEPLPRTEMTVPQGFQAGVAVPLPAAS